MSNHDKELLLRRLEREQLARQETEDILDRVTLKLYHANHSLSQMAVTDRLTQLYNRHKLDEVLIQQQHLAERYKNNFGIIIIDIDFFKKINDAHGHQTGDVILKELSNILKNSSRKSDVVGRWGGEEFMIIIPNVSEQPLFIVAEKLQRDIKKHKFPQVDILTVSMGVSISHPGESFENIISRADEALYQAKENGRNCSYALLHNKSFNLIGAKNAPSS